MFQVLVNASGTNTGDIELNVKKKPSTVLIVPAGFRISRNIFSINNMEVHVKLLIISTEIKLDLN